MPELKNIGQHNRIAMQAANQGQNTKKLPQLAIALAPVRKASNTLQEIVTQSYMALVNNSERICFQEAHDPAHLEIPSTLGLVKSIKTNGVRLRKQAAAKAA